MTKFQRQAARWGVLGVLLAGLSPLQAQTIETDRQPLAGLPLVSLGECLVAARQNGPAVQTAGLALEAASAVLTQTTAKQGLAVGESVGYSHVGTSQSNTVAMSAASAAASAGNGGVLGENLKGGVSLSGPDSSVAVSAIQSLPPNSTDKVSSFGLTGNQVLWDGLVGGIPAATVSLARSTFEIAKITEDAALKTASFETEQAYYTLLGDQKTLEVRWATWKMAEANLLQEQSLFQAKRATELDVLQVQVSARQARLDWNKALNQAATDRKWLSVAVGWPIEKLYQVSDEPFPSPGAADAAAGVKTALTQRSELRILSQNLISSQVNLQIQKALSSPVVTLTGSLGVGQDWTSSTSAQNFSLGADLALPSVYDGGLTSAQVRQAQAQLSSYGVQQNQLRQAIAVAVENDFFALQDTKDRLDLAQTNVEAAQGEYDLEKAKLSLGLETTPNVLTAFTNLITAQVGQEQARSSYVLAVLQFNNDLGL